MYIILKFSCSYSLFNNANSSRFNTIRFNNKIQYEIQIFKYNVHCSISFIIHQSSFYNLHHSKKQTRDYDQKSARLVTREAQWNHLRDSKKSTKLLHKITSETSFSCLNLVVKWIGPTSIYSRLRWIVDMLPPAWSKREDATASLQPLLSVNSKPLHGEEWDALKLSWAQWEQMEEKNALR